MGWMLRCLEDLLCLIYNIVGRTIGGRNDYELSCYIHLHGWMSYRRRCLDVLAVVEDHEIEWRMEETITNSLANLGVYTHLHGRIQHWSVLLKSEQSV